MSTNLPDSHVRFRSATLGIDLDALVLCDPDPDRPDTLLAKVVGPAPPNDQTASRVYHARCFAGLPVPSGDGLATLPRPDEENTVRPVAESDLWPDGAWVLECDDRKAFERSEFGGETLAEIQAREHPTLEQILTQWKNDPDGHPLENDDTPQSERPSELDQ